MLGRSRRRRDENLRDKAQAELTLASATILVDLYLAQGALSEIAAPACKDRRRVAMLALDKLKARREERE